MRISLLSNDDVHGPDQLDAVEWRAKRLLGRAAGHITDLAVELIDTGRYNGATHALSKAQARVNDGRMVVVQARSHDVTSTVDRVLLRLATRVTKECGDEIDVRRPALPFMQWAEAY
ncbi:MAG: hypothetical protein ACRC2H_06355 [Silanimonas sp.]